MGREPWCAALIRRTYTDSPDWPDYTFGYDVWFATCDYCGWDGPTCGTPQRAERSRWRHPDVLCWLRASWFAVKI